MAPLCDCASYSCAIAAAAIGKPEMMPNAATAAMIGLYTAVSHNTNSPASMNARACKTKHRGRTRRHEETRGMRMFEDLIAAWMSLKEASAAMTAGPRPQWPWDPADPVYIENLRRRDTVQGRGMRFAGIWHSHAEDIRALVTSDPEGYPEFHVVPKKGELPDPTSYMQSMAIMPRLIAGRGA
jgi:hypothetical protein